MEQKEKKIRKLTYKFENPYNSCEKIYFCEETNRYYTLIPYTPYSDQLATCTPSKGYYEADCPVKAGLLYEIGGKVVETQKDGEIIDQLKKEEYDNKEMIFFVLKPEFAACYENEFFTTANLLPKLYDYMKPEHFEEKTFKRQDVECCFGRWYQKKRDVKFVVGQQYSHEMLYGGHVDAKVSSISDDRQKVIFTEYWTSEDTGHTESADTEYPISVDQNGNEYVVVWEYKSQEGRVYAK